MNGAFIFVLSTQVEHLRTPNNHVEPVTLRGEDKGEEKNDQQERKKPKRVKRGNTGVGSTSDSHGHNATDTMSG